MRIVTIPCRVIGIALTNDTRDADDGAGIGIGVIEQDTVPNVDLVTEEITGLIVANAIPVGRLLLCRLEVGDREIARLRFE